MARGDAFRAALSGAGQTGKVEPMTTEGTTDEGTEGTEGAGSGSAADAPTPEEVEALRQENETLKKAENTRRTEAARAAKAKADQDRRAARGDKALNFHGTSEGAKDCGPTLS